MKEQDVGKRIGANLRQFRMSRGISLEALAKQIGVSKQTLIKIERGEANPTLSVIWRISNGLEVPITALLSLESDVAIGLFMGRMWQGKQAGSRAGSAKTLANAQLLSR